MPRGKSQAPRITTKVVRHSPLYRETSLQKLKSDEGGTRAIPPKLIEMRLQDGSTTWVPFLLLFPEMEHIVRRRLATFIEPE